MAAAKKTRPQLTKQERELVKHRNRQISRERALLDKRLNGMLELKIKLILVGNASVGKTSLIQKYVDDKADIRTTLSTMVCDLHHCMTYLTGRNVHIRMWDTAGMERFHMIDVAKSYYRNSDGVLLVYSIDDHESFTALPKWLEIVRENIGPTSQFDCCIVGNKSDMSEKRMVSRSEAERYAHQLGFPYIETSALDVVNVQKAFTDLALAVIRRYEITQRANGTARQLSRDSSDGSTDKRRCGCN